MLWRRFLGLPPLLIALHFGAAAATETPIIPKHPTLPEALDDPADVTLPDPDLWQRIRMGFALEPLESPLVAEHEAWYSARPDYIKRFVDRGSRYLHYIVEQVEKRGMPMEIALLPVVESALPTRVFAFARLGAVAVHSLDGQELRAVAGLVEGQPARHRRRDRCGAQLSPAPA